MKNLKDTIVESLNINERFAIKSLEDDNSKIKAEFSRLKKMCGIYFDYEKDKFEKQKAQYTSVQNANETLFYLDDRLESFANFLAISDYRIKRGEFEKLGGFHDIMNEYQNKINGYIQELEQNGIPSVFKKIFDEYKEIYSTMVAKANEFELK